MHKYTLTKSELERLYIGQELSTNDIGQTYGCNNGTVWYWLHKYGLPIRNNKQASLVGRPKSGRVITLPIEELTHLYVDERMPLKIIGKRFKCSKWLISDRLKKAGIQIRQREEALTDFGRAVLWSPEMRKKRIQAEKNLWSSMSRAQRSRRLKQLALGACRKPNIPEKIVLEILSTYFPNEWAYVGNGSVIINGLNPDFINCDGQKLIIEVFGDYWHTKRVRKYHETEEGRIEAYKKYGYATLIIWESETKDTDTVLKKVTDFVAGGRRV